MVKQSQPDALARDRTGNHATSARSRSTPFVPQGRATRPALSLRHAVARASRPEQLSQLRARRPGHVGSHHFSREKWLTPLLLLVATLVLGCSAVPDVRTKRTYHNPFPQISRVAVLPFRNQSEEPTLSGIRVSLAYYNELQSVPGFEVLPLGVVENQLTDFERNVIRRPIATAQDFQQFAKFLGVDAVLQGAVTDYSPYYPPRMTLKVNWYAANPGLYPIPVGYGLPWGTKAEKKIPSWIRLEAERALAKEQLATQTPIDYESESGQLLSPTIPEPRLPKEPFPSEELRAPTPAPKGTPTPATPDRSLSKRTYGTVFAIEEDVSVMLAGHEEVFEPARLPAKVSTLQRESRPSTVEESNRGPGVSPGITFATPGETPGPRVEVDSFLPLAQEEGIPENWPDPRGFVPRRPTPTPPPMEPQYEPILSHMKAYNGNDEDFTQSLQEYYYFRDDARFGGWQSYLQRSEDFIRFCCHLHIVETLSSRGGELESRLNLRWPVYRYER